MNIRRFLLAALALVIVPTMALADGIIIIDPPPHPPKPIVPLANIPFLFFQIDPIKRADIPEIILSLSYQP